MSVFKDIKPKSLDIERTIQHQGKEYLGNLSSFRIGAGRQAVKGDQSGIWLGGEKFVDANWSVDINGNQILNGGSITSNGTLIIDGEGIVSGNAFKAESTLGTVFIEAADGVVTVVSESIVLTRNVLLLVLVDAQVIGSTGANYTLIDFVVQTSNNGGAWSNISTSLTTVVRQVGYGQTVSDHYIAQYGAGTRAFRIQAEVAGSGELVTLPRLTILKLGT